MKQLFLLRQILASPERVSSLSTANWSELLCQCYATRLLGRLHEMLKEQDLIEHVPQDVRWHFESASRYSQAHAADIAIEVIHIERALKIAGIRAVFLKGVAYQLAGDTAAKGRVFSDLDLYVDQQQLDSAEQLLQWNGWRRDEISEYDEAYYRRWMHELPAMTHLQRGSTIDLHHSLLPLTGRLTIDNEALQNQLDAGDRTLNAVDRIIHSACHLLLESEFDKGLRDLSDLDCLLRQHGADNQGFWRDLTARGQQLGVGRILFYALRYCHRLLATPVDSRAQDELSRHAPGTLQLKLMDWLFDYVLTTPGNYDRGAANQLAHFLMFIRGHWMRMPLTLLIPHLFHKAFISSFQSWNKSRIEAAVKP